MTAQQTADSPAVQIGHVLVPLDGSEFSREAIRTARSLAEHLDAELHTISIAGGSREADRLRAFGAETLNVDAADGHATVVVAGDPAHEIVAHAEDLGSCLVCLSTHGRGRLAGSIIGSVARSLLQRSPDPVVAVGPSADRPGWSPAPRWPGPLSVRRLVACVDGTPTSEEVLPAASAWARTLGMSMTILTVKADTLAPIEIDRQASRYGASADAETYIDELVQRWFGHGVDVDGQVIADPISPASGVQAHLAQRPAGLVAVSTHARSGLQRIRSGASAATIVRASVAPCLVVPVRR